MQDNIYNQTERPYTSEELIQAMKERKQWGFGTIKCRDDGRKGIAPMIGGDNRYLSYIRAEHELDFNTQPRGSR